MSVDYLLRPIVDKKTYDWSDKCEPAWPTPRDKPWCWTGKIRMVGSAAPFTTSNEAAQSTGDCVPLVTYFTFRNTSRAFAGLLLLETMSARSGFVLGRDHFPFDTVVDQATFEARRVAAPEMPKIRSADVILAACHQRTRLNVIPPGRGHNFW
jgi:hypothetical protein